MGNIIQISGKISEIIFFNEENGYTVCEVESRKEGIFTATGYLPFINEGDSAILTGEWVTHPDYGEQFKVTSFETTLPNDEESILQYLSTGIVKGVREGTAKKIVEYFGAESLTVMQASPERLAEIKGISPKKAREIGENFAKLQAVQGIVMFLQKFKISANMAMKVHKILGQNAVDVIKQNPYILADKIDGINFKTADNIAFVLGHAKNSTERIRAGIKFLLTSAAYMSGHTYLPEDILIEDIVYNLGIEKEEAKSALASLVLEHDIYSDVISNKKVCYLTSFISAEEYIARRLTSLTLTEQKFGMNDSEVESFIDKIENEKSITLAPEQRNAVITSLKSSCMVLTGGPGTGKTTAINAIIEIMKSLKLKIALAAPTGRAAKRLSEVTGCEAKTIHRLLGVIPDSDNAFTHDERNPLSADVLILDEVSMIDIQLMYAVLRAVKGGARIILAGDADQLPSVGPGNVLGDIIKSEIVPVIRLERIFRQAGESLIIVNAHKINRGEMPELGAKNKDFFFLKRANVEDTAKTIIDLYKTRLPESYNLNPISDIQVLSPSKRGPAGTIALNKSLQYAINPPHVLKIEYKSGQITYRVGDKVMQIKNNYDLPWQKENGEHGTGVFNGDMGIISDISTKDKIMTVIFDDDKEAEYPFAYLDELDLAYAITVHKSQGSEFPFVIMPMCNFAPALMCRNLFYTAVTRAKTMAVLVGSEHAVQRMVHGAEVHRRFTGLGEKLKMMKNLIEE